MLIYKACAAGKWPVAFLPKPLHDRSGPVAFTHADWGFTKLKAQVVTIMTEHGKFYSAMAIHFNRSRLTTALFKCVLRVVLSLGRNKSIYIALAAHRLDSRSIPALNVNNKLQIPHILRVCSAYEAAQCRPVTKRAICQYEGQNTYQALLRPRVGTALPLALTLTSA